VANALLEVQATFTSLDKRYTILRVACRTPGDRAALSTQYDDAETNYYACVNKTLEDDDSVVARLSTDLQAANMLVDRSVSQMGNMSKVIDNITQAVGLGAQLVAKIAV
jgi:hypothetical protein